MRLLFEKTLLFGPLRLFQMVQEQLPGWLPPGLVRPVPRGVQAAELQGVALRLALRGEQTGSAQPHSPRVRSDRLRHDRRLLSPPQRGLAAHLRTFLGSLHW